jgi:glycosyltransferase involved in cell wall biosynthesis
MTMRILQIGETDLVGKRFNGHNLQAKYKEDGYASYHLVWKKESTDENTINLCSKNSHVINNIIFKNIERIFSIQSVLYPWNLKILVNSFFKSADIVHYHILQNYYFSLLTLPLLTKKRPSVWTLHDPWALTGHCIYPYDCNRWEIGCGNCPYLKTPLPLNKDNTNFLWEYKKYIYKKSNFDIIVASKWMKKMVERSPLMENHKIHLVPFGIDLNIFRKTDSIAAKKVFNIDTKSIVITFRATKNEFKGLYYVKKALGKLNSKHPITLMTFQEKGLLDEFKGRYRVIDVGWIDDDEMLVNAYNASDIVLMPSTAEAFGLMAIEAMACGKPVVVFDDTSLPEITFAPNGGIVAKYKDIDHLYNIVQGLVENTDMRNKIGEQASIIAKREYNFLEHVEKTICVYKEVIQRHKTKINKSKFF